MYHPYFRGKQFELITIRETAPLLAGAGFVPIIEPVRESLSGLERTLATVVDAGGKAVIVVNPHCGDHIDDGQLISNLVNDKFKGQDNIIAGLFLSEQATADEVLAHLEVHADNEIALIHAGFTNARQLSEKLGAKANAMCHIFFEENCGKLYRKHFMSDKRVLLRDGFQRRVNREYPQIEFFSDLHITFKEENMNGFGDFLIVGNSYSEMGGPAYAVAIHLTFIDDDKDDGMYVHHFLSERQDTPTDPAGKFAEALKVMISELKKPETMILETEAVKEFRALAEAKHFPGLGYVKKLSMKHHIETLADYFDDAD